MLLYNIKTSQIHPCYGTLMNMNEEKVRTRYAPSPTGYQHVGNIRTGLFAWLVARHYGGKFILRIEDTDKKREVSGAIEHLLKCLNTLGLEYDEGFNKSSEYGPYCQSGRLDIYKKWAHKLVESGRAYADPYTSNEVQEFREAAQKAKRPFLYRNHRPTDPPSWDGTMPLRFKSAPKAHSWHDEVMGDLSTGPEVVDDIILIKSDGYPTYNFAHIVDDFEMEITHIIRGQEFLASVPNYLNIYEALNITPPIMATMPHIMNEQGNKKLSKRDGAKDVLDYIKEGFLPEALVSFIATLGWNDGTTQEVFTQNELIEKFSLSRVGKSGAQFDNRRLLWTNGYFIRELSIDELYEKVSDEKTHTYWPDSAANATIIYKKQVLRLVQERLKYFVELPELTHFFFEEPTIDMQLIDSNKQLKKREYAELKELLNVTIASLKNIEPADFNADIIQGALNQLLEQTGEKPGTLFSIIRIATTWSAASPPLAESMAVLGQETVLQRLQSAYDSL